MPSLLALLLAASPLASSPSPYLREAASSPIGWRSHGAAAFAEAKRQKKAVLLDVGAGWCHWCHVMDEGTYRDPGVIAEIAAHYIPVKIDRDLSPDLDAFYQRSAQALSESGGWPLTVLLSPDGAPYAAATYLPPAQMLAFLDKEQKGYEAPSPEARRLLMGLHLEAEQGHRAPTPGAPAGSGLPELPALIDKLAAAMEGQADPEHGGFGTRGPKFPNAPGAQLFLALADEKGGGPRLAIAQKALDGMAVGGVRDQVGGCFHRYAVDPAWRMPHFEKMLNVNAALLDAYLDGAQATGSALYREVADECVDYLLGPAGSDPRHGGFFASQDADAREGDDGSYYTWTLEELRAAGGDEAVTLFSAQAEPRDLRTDPRQNVLHLASPGLHPRALVERLRAARAQRSAPRIDPMRYTDWNGMAIQAMFKAGATLGRPDATHAALAALDFFLSRKEQVGRHAFGPDGRLAGEASLWRLADLAQLALASLAAYQATGREDYLAAARKLIGQADSQLWDAGASHYRDSTSPLQAPSGMDDAPSPAANAAMALALLRCAALSCDRGRETVQRERADRVLGAFAPQIPALGSFGASYGLALLERDRPRVTVAVAQASARDPRAQPLRDASLSAYRFGHVVTRDRDATHPTGKHGEPLAYVCGARSCAPPTSDPRKLQQLIASWER
jgi:uncharacterized protein YyaL (SSP411 family)